MLDFQILVTTDLISLHVYQYDMYYKLSNAHQPMQNSAISTDKLDGGPWSDCPPTDPPVLDPTRLEWTRCKIMQNPVKSNHGTGEAS